MIFNSLTFLLYFLPLSIVAYFLCKDIYKKVALLVLSVLFYVLSDIKSLPVIVLIIVVNYYFSKLYNLYKVDHEKHKKYFYIMIIWDVLLLMFFKFNKMPLGLSFIIFNVISYQIDNYKDSEVGADNIIDFSIYIMFFGKILQGPLVKYKEWNNSRIGLKLTLEDVGVGAEDFIRGLALKCIICTNILSCIEYIDIGNYSYISLLLHEILFVVYLYLDFYSYTIMATGIAEIFGYSLPINFNYPLCATSLTSFWRKWHMTLSFWFRDYVYIPLGGNRNGVVRTIINIFIVWLFTGIWHGVSINFILWGMLNFIFLIIEKYLFYNKISKIKVINHIWTLILVVLIFISFEYTDPADFIDTYRCLFFIRKITFYNSYVWDILSNYMIWIILGILCCTPLGYRVYINIKRRSYLLMLMVNIALVVLSICYIVSSSYAPFMYIKF